MPESEEQRQARLLAEGAIEESRNAEIQRLRERAERAEGTNHHFRLWQKVKRQWEEAEARCARYRKALYSLRTSACERIWAVWETCHREATIEKLDPEHVLWKGSGDLFAVQWPVKHAAIDGVDAVTKEIRTALEDSEGRT